MLATVAGFGEKGGVMQADSPRILRSRGLKPAKHSFAVPGGSFPEPSIRPAERSLVSPERSPAPPEGSLFAPEGSLAATERSPVAPEGSPAATERSFSL